MVENVDYDCAVDSSDESNNLQTTFARDMTPPIKNDAQFGHHDHPDGIIQLSRSQRQTGGRFDKIIFQIRLLMWKRLMEQIKDRNDLIKLFVPPVMIFVLMILLYEAFPFFADGGMEQIFVPLAFWVYIQRLVVHIMYEKATRLQESMRMMGLSDFAYWVSYFLTDGIILGFILSLVCTILTVGGLFNSGGFGAIFGLFLVFCLAAVPFGFFLTAFYDTPQSCGQATFGLLAGMIAVYMVVLISGNRETSLELTQHVLCLFPPMGLQVGASTFLKSHTGITLPVVCGILVADVFIYSLLAWYFSQVMPSSLGVRKPFYFVLLPSYWCPRRPNRSPSSNIGRGPVTHTCPEEGAGVSPSSSNAECGGGRRCARVDCLDGEHNHHSNEYGSGGGGRGVHVPTEEVNEHLLGAPTVVVDRLCKTFHGAASMAVNFLSFDMYENQIFALLGHNGAGKTTCINMLTGMTSPDLFHETQTSIYGSSLLHDMDQIRYSMGVCPQHDVLFEKLSVREHILFFAQLKGASFEQALREADYYCGLFHLRQRLDHLGNELSGGQRRKLSVAIAVCGGSKFVVLDEPTAGMDPLARRELWDLLSSLRTGRTMLLTTHYMDEADILGDRVGIMSLGQMQCVGSTQFLKRTYGAGYKLIFDRIEGTEVPAQAQAEQEQQLALLVQSHVPDAVRLVEEGSEAQVLFTLPFESVGCFGALFADLEARSSSGNAGNAGKDQGRSQGQGQVQGDLSVDFGVSGNFGVTITSLEDVFLKVGEDHTVRPTSASAPGSTSAAGGGEGGVAATMSATAVTAHNVVGIGADRSYRVNFFSQVAGIVRRRLVYAVHDPVTIPLVFVPVVGAITGAVLYAEEVVSTINWVKDLLQAGVYCGAYLGAPGLIAEFIVRERNNKLRNVLTVMGCGFEAYWLGTFIADLMLMMIPLVLTWIIWLITPIDNFYNGNQGLAFCYMILFMVQLICFSYFFSFAFSTPKACITFMPVIVLLLLITPNLVLVIVILLTDLAGREVSDTLRGSILLWGSMITSPQGALFAGFMNSVNDYEFLLEELPPPGAVVAFMVGEAVLFMLVAYLSDVSAIASVQPLGEDPSFDAAAALKDLDEDVQQERDRTAKALGAAGVVLHTPGSGDGVEQDEEAGFVAKNDQRQQQQHQQDRGAPPVVLQRLRKVFKPKVKGRKAVEAVQDVSFIVNGGEIFGLLGANGAGKTSVLSMLTRALLPTSGDAFVVSHSVLSNFSTAATHLGVVTQSNALWDRLTTEDHLYLFARLRGVPEDLVKQVVEGTINQLELTPHRKKLAMNLSGGMKRKLCVAIALIGDPEVVLLDEPSAGLDPVSRRNLWSVILRTMSHRAVILTTHSMEEAEALCKRIGIMVHGQLRALGTKQHLKLKFGSGFELVVKLHVAAPAEIESAIETAGTGAGADDIIASAAAAAVQDSPGDAQPADGKVATASTTNRNAGRSSTRARSEAEARATAQEHQRRKHQLQEFVTGMFPSAALLTENGGLLTFRIPREEMRMGVAFSQLEQHRQRLHIEDYSVAQPTLEQVFIRTITEDRKHETSRRESRRLSEAGSDAQQQQGQSQSQSQSQHECRREGGLLGRLLLPSRGLNDEEGEGEGDEVELPMNKCGCTTRFTKLFAVLTFVVFAITWGVAFTLPRFTAPRSALFFVGFLFLVTSFVGCNLLCCACCKAPSGNDE